MNVSEKKTPEKPAELTPGPHCSTPGTPKPSSTRASSRTGTIPKMQTEYQLKMSEMINMNCPAKQSSRSNSPFDWNYDSENNDSRPSSAKATPMSSPRSCISTSSHDKAKANHDRCVKWGEELINKQTENTNSGVCIRRDADGEECYIFAEHEVEKWKEVSTDHYRATYLRKNGSL